jgi:hypothetical protein
VVQWVREIMRQTSSLRKQEMLALVEDEGCAHEVSMRGTEAEFAQHYLFFSVVLSLFVTASSRATGHETDSAANAFQTSVPFPDFLRALPLVELWKKRGAERQRP